MSESEVSNWGNAVCIETERLILRCFSEGDFADLQEILGDTQCMQYLEPPYTSEKTKDFLNRFCIAKKGALAAAQKETGKVIGYILFHALEETVYEIGWIFNRAFWRRGYAYEACSALIEHAFSALPVHKIYAETIDAVKSVGLMKKLGMHLEETQYGQVKDALGQRADLYIYSLLKEKV